jgi:hypothetical protein
MKVVRCGGAAFGPVIEDHPAWTEISHELEKGTDIFSDGLGAMVQMGDGEVRRENGHGIAEDQVFASVKDPFLPHGELIQAKEALQPLSIPEIHIGRTALHPSGIILETDGKPPAGKVPLPDLLQRIAAFPKIQPASLLL